MNDKTVDADVADGGETTDTSQDQSLRASLEASYEALSKSGGEEPEAAAPKAGNTTDAAPEGNSAAAPPAADSVGEPPAALTAGMKSRWATLDPETRAEFSKLSKDAAQAASKFGEESKFAASIRSEFEPYRQLMQHYNATEVGTLRSALRSIGILTVGSAEEKAAEIRAIAQAYGVDIGKLGEAPATPQIPEPISRELAELRGTVSTLSAGQAEYYRQRAQADLDQFLAAEKPAHFDMVKGRMAELMRAGHALTFKDAYDQAVMLVPEAREAFLQAELEKRRAAAAEEANRARRAAGSTRGQPRTEVPAKQGGTVRESLEEAWDALSS